MLEARWGKAVGRKAKGEAEVLLLEIAVLRAGALQGRMLFPLRYVAPFDIMRMHVYALRNVA